MPPTSSGTSSHLSSSFSSFGSSGVAAAAAAASSPSAASSAAATVDVPSSAAADLPPRGDASLPPRRVARRRRRPPSLVEREKTPRRSRLLECSTPRARARFTSVPFARCSSRVESCRVVSCFLRGGLRWSTAVVAIASSPPILLVSESSSLLVHPSPSPAARGGRGSPFFLLCFVCVVLRI